MLLMSLERNVLRDSVQQKLDSAKLQRRRVILKQEADIMPDLEAFACACNPGCVGAHVSNVSMLFRKASSKQGQSLVSRNLWHGPM